MKLDPDQIDTLTELTAKILARHEEDGALVQLAALANAATELALRLGPETCAALACQFIQEAYKLDPDTVLAIGRERH
jgi:hypothetical protein